MLKNKRCLKCILPKTYPNIRFNEEGICNLCLGFDKSQNEHQEKSKADLDKIIARYKGKSEKYDVIVGLSGGKDSTYVAYYLMKKYNLKILGFNYDMGYRSKYALENLETITDRLDIDLVSIKPNCKFLKKLFAHFLKNRGEFCSVCNNLGYLMGASFIWGHKLSLGFAPLSVGGWSKQYEFQEDVSVTSMEYFFNNLTTELLDELLTQAFIQKDVVRAYMKLKDPRQAQMGTAAFKQLGDYAINLIQLPDYIKWNIIEIPHILSKELGWKHPPDVHESHFDCTLFPLKEYLKFKKYGLTQETIKNSVLIREGLMTRKEAMERKKMEQTTEPEILEAFFDELKISKDEINWDAEWSR